MKKIFFTSLLLFLSIFSFCQESISIVTQGSGSSFDIARKNALRYALVKVYGVFINSTTIVSNDDLTMATRRSFHYLILKQMKIKSLLSIMKIFFL